MKILSLLILLCASLALGKAAGFPGPTDEVERDESLTEDPSKKFETDENLLDAPLGEDTGNNTNVEEPVFDSVTEEMYLKGVLSTNSGKGVGCPLFGALLVFCSTTTLNNDNVKSKAIMGLFKTALNGTAHRSGSCSPGWTRLRGRCYHVFPILSTWFKAQKNCRSIGAHLASVHDFDMNYQLLKLITAAGQSRREVWIGGSDLHREGRWTWVDGTHFGYTNWCRWEPNNFFYNQHCLEMNYSRSKCWDDNNCYYEIPFICARNY